MTRFTFSWDTALLDASDIMSGYLASFGGA